MPFYRGVDFVTEINGVEIIADTINPKWMPADDDREPANESAPVKHIYGGNVEIDFKGAIEQALPRGGSTFTFAMRPRDAAVNASVFPEMIQDIMNGVYDRWGMADFSADISQKTAENDFTIRNRVVSAITTGFGTAAP